MRYIGRGVRTREETEVGLLGMIAHWKQHGFGMWTLALKEEKALIGRCGLCYLDQTLGSRSMKPLGTPARAASPPPRVSLRNSWPQK